MSALDWTLALTGGALLYAALAVGLGRFCAAADRAEQYPPLSQDDDATWLAAWPTELPQDQVDRLFADLIATEGLQ